MNCLYIISTFRVRSRLETAFLHLATQKMSASLYLLFILLQVLCSTRTTTAADSLHHVCEGGNYTAKSSFQSNLQLLLHNLAASGDIYTNLTEATTPGGTAYGLTLCRGDIDFPECQICVQSATEDVLSLCPHSKRVTVWYDYCEIRYSDINFFSSDPIDNNVFIKYMYTVENITDPATFITGETILMLSLAYQAAYNFSLFFATGILQYSTNGSIYGLAQCTRDLSESQCSNCLDVILKKYLSDTDGRQGGRVALSSCNVRYETDKFFEGKPMVNLSLSQQSTLGRPNTNDPRKPMTPPPPPPAQAPLTRAPPTKAAPTQSPATQGNKNTGNIVRIVIPLVAVLVLVLVFTFAIFFWRRKSAKELSRMAQLEEISSTNSLLFDLSIIRSATSNFSEANKLGQGGFGFVYKGTLQNRQEIAVKRLSTRSNQGIEELKNELVLVAKLQHKNLVRLLGVCLDEEEKLLVYEYVPNRSLDTFLFDPIKREQLNWERRFKIIGGIAQGLFYLHEQCHLKVIHRDLKASNILLDEDMNPKISDFGPSRLFGGEETQSTTSRVVGTFGYMAPEYAKRGQFSIKSDAYSYGVLILEIVTGRKNNSFNYTDLHDDLISYTWDHWDNGKAIEIIDPSLGEKFSAAEVMICIRIGLLCTQDSPSDRPLMSSILPLLNTSSILLSDPSKPTFSSEKSFPGSNDSEQSSSLVLKNRSSSKRPQTIIDPR